jgi:cell shape-determining protein MreD
MESTGRRPGSGLLSSISGAGAGLLATSCCGSGALSLALIGLGAGSSFGAFAATHDMQAMSLVFFALAVAVVLSASYFAIYRRRARISGMAFRALYLQTLTRTAAWSVGAYLVWFIILQPIMWKFHISIPQPKG